MPKIQQALVSLSTFGHKGCGSMLSETKHISQLFCYIMVNGSDLNDTTNISTTATSLLKRFKDLIASFFGCDTSKKFYKRPTIGSSKPGVNESF